MRQIVRSSMRRSLSHVVGVLAVLPLLTNAAQSESESERAFRERRSNILRSQDPDRVRIDRPQSAPVTTKVEGIGENADGETVGKPQNATLSVSVSSTEGMARGTLPAFLITTLSW